MNEKMTVLPKEMTPEFDYSGLSEQTVADLHLAEDEYRRGKKLAERGLVHMGDAIAIAHDTLCGVVAQCDNSDDGACRTMRRAHNNQHSEDSFRAWCLSIGITKDAAYRLLQVSALMDGSNPRQKQILESLPPTLLYAIAKPSAPPELVEQAKNGGITTNKQYQDLLAQLKAKDDELAAEKNRADAAEVREEEAWKLTEKAKSRAEAAESQLDAVLADVNGLSEENSKLEQQLEGSRQVAEAAKLRADKYKAEAEAARKAPIEAVVDEEEVDRRAAEKAYQMASDMTADLRAKKEADDALAEIDARNAYDSILLADRSIQNNWKMAKPLFLKLSADQRELLANMIVRTLGQIQGEVTKCL